MNWKCLLVLPTVAATAVLTLSALAGANTAGADTTYTWDLTQDMGQDYVNNPIADSYGNAGVWTYEDGAVGGETSLYTTLDRYQDDAQCNAAFHTGSSGYPAVAFHYGTSDETCGTPTFPARTVLLHPANNGDSAAVRWTSPITGTVHLAATFTDRDANGGDGFTYQVSDDNGSNLESGTVDNGGTSGAVTYGTSVRAGQSLYVSVGPNGGYDYDTTELDLVITGQSATAPQTVALGTHVSQGRTNGQGNTKVTIKVTLRAGKGDPEPTGYVSADGFSCRALRDTTPAGRPTRAQSVCTGTAAPGHYETQVQYSGDEVYAPASTVVSYDVGTTA